MKTINLAVLAFSMTACGGNGKLMLELTDAPPDLTEMKSVFVTLSRMEAHAVDEEPGIHLPTSIPSGRRWE